MVELNKIQTELIQNIKQKQWAKVEEIWLDLMENPPEDPSFYEYVSEKISRNGGKKRLPDLWEIPISQFMEGEKYELVLTLAGNVVTHNPDCPNLQPMVHKAFKEVYNDHPNLTLYIRQSGLRDQDQPLGESLTQCDEFINFDEGEIFQHISWGIGRVVDLDVRRKKVFIDFPNLKNKAFTFEGAHQYLTKLPHDHFLVLEEIDPARLKALSEENPLELVKILLKSFDGCLDQPRLREILTNKIISTKRFSSWWNKVKNSLRNDPWIELGTGNRPEIRLRHEAKDFLDEMLERFEKAHTLPKKRQVLKAISQNQKGAPIPKEKAMPFASRVRVWHSGCKDGDIGCRLRMLYLMDEVAGLMPVKPAPLEDTEEDLLNATDDLVELLEDLSIYEYQCRALDRRRLMNSDENLDILTRVYLEGPAKISQYSFEKMLEMKEFEQAGNAARLLIEHFDRNPETYAWTVKNILKRKWPEIKCPYTDFTLMEGALHHLERVRQKYVPESRDAKYNRHIQGKLRSIFTEDKFAILEKVIDEITYVNARRFHNSILTSPVFINSVKDNIDNIFRKVRKDLFEEDKKESKPKIHYCTAEKLKVNQDELRRIKTVEIPRNSKDIEEARAHGDLSENAEYDAAKDRQAMLMNRMNTLQDLIARARIIQPEHINTEIVSIGTRFKVKNIDTGETEQYCILGPWEADPENHILSYLSPLGQQFLGKSLEETLQAVLPGGKSVEYKILYIENALLTEA